MLSLWPEQKPGRKGRLDMKISPAQQAFIASLEMTQTDGRGSFIAHMFRPGERAVQRFDLRDGWIVYDPGCAAFTTKIHVFKDAKGVWMHGVVAGSGRIKEYADCKAAFRAAREAINARLKAGFVLIPQGYSEGAIARREALKAPKESA